MPERMLNAWTIRGWSVVAVAMVLAIIAVAWNARVLASCRRSAPRASRRRRSVRSVGGVTSTTIRHHLWRTSTATLRPTCGWFRSKFGEVTGRG